MRWLVIGLGFIVAAAVGTSQAQGQNVPAKCAEGFTANPKDYKSGEKYDQSYTCTGPKAVCSPGFTLQEIAVPIPPPPGTNRLGTTDYVNGVTIKNGVMVYTCAEPQQPPK